MTNKKQNFVNELNAKSICIYERNCSYHTDLMSIAELYGFDVYFSDDKVVVNNEVFEELADAQRKVDEIMEAVDVNEYRQVFDSKQGATNWVRQTENLTEEQKSDLLADIEKLEV